MHKHTNQQHSVKLTRWLSPAARSYEEHAARLWWPVKVQTFFRERRYVRYFFVQAEEKGDEEEQQRGEQEQGEQQDSERQGDYCERSVGTVFQLPNPDAIYSRDEGKERKWLPSHVVCVCARSTRC
jgi:hypothetical protein